MGKVQRYSLALLTEGIENSTLFNGGHIAVLGKEDVIAKGLEGAAVTDCTYFEIIELSPQLLLVKTSISPEVPEAFT